MTSSSNSWRELYLSAMREEDPTATLKLVNLAFDSIKDRLDVLPNGLADLQEMREIKVALGQLLKLRRRTLRQRQKHDRYTGLASTFKRLIRAT
jgi:hypothetical protein